MKVAKIVATSTTALFSTLYNHLLAYDRDSDTLFRVDTGGMFTPCSGYRTMIKDITYGPVFFNTVRNVCSLFYTEEHRLVITLHKERNMEVIDVLSIGYAQTSTRVSFKLLPRKHYAPWIVTSLGDVLTIDKGELRLVTQLPNDADRAFGNPDGKLLCETKNGLQLYNLDTNEWTQTDDNTYLINLGFDEKYNPVYFTTKINRDKNGKRRVKRWVWEKYQPAPEITDVYEEDHVDEVYYSGDTVFMIERM